MDWFLCGLVMFLLANILLATTILRRINLHNDSVIAWEQAQLKATPVSATTVTPQLVTYSGSLMADAA